MVGDAPEAITYDNLNRAFRLVRAGAELIGMHRNPWWLTPDGSDARLGSDGHRSRVRDRALGRILGKPSADFFARGRRALGAEIRAQGGRRLRRREIAMVGDDIRTDVLAAQRVGLRGAFVLSGKQGRGHEPMAAGRAGRRPDVIAPTLRDVVSALA